MPDLDGTVYVYAVLEVPPQQTAIQWTGELRGVGGAEVTPVEHDGLVALTSQLPDRSLTAADLRAHWAVVEGAFEHATVLPVRFGIALESEDAVRERVLGQNAEALRDLLREMAGLVQLNLKGRYDEEALLRQIVRESHAIRALRERLRHVPGDLATQAEQVRLGQLVGHEVTRRQQSDAAAVLDALGPFAIATRAEQAAHPIAFNLAFLVRESERDAFDQAVTIVREDLGDCIELRYIGPLPPYSFADVELGIGRPAWA